MGKKSTSAEAISIFLGRALLPDKDGKPQRKVTPREARDIAERRNGGRR